MDREERQRQQRIAEYSSKNQQSVENRSVTESNCSTNVPDLLSSTIGSVNNDENVKPPANEHI